MSDAEPAHELLLPPHPDGWYGSSATCRCGDFQWDAESADALLASLREVEVDWKAHVAEK